jgi:tellurite resistance protein TerC
MSLWFWIGFNIFILGLLALDLGVFHRKAHEVSLKEAAGWSVAWIALAMVFNTVVYFWLGKQAALEFLTGYLIEKSLSVDNIFVFVLVFSYFAVPKMVQHRVLFWGVIGALLMRGVLIGAGAFLITRFHWIIYVFGAFLVFTGIKMAFQDQHAVEPEKNPVIRLIRRLMPVTENYEGSSLFVRREGRWWATPLFVVLAVVETTDLIFAVDSIPAIFAVTRNAFLVYTSNVFAILGLRSLYFLLADIIQRFHLLQLGLAIVLVFVGAKMLLAEWYKIPIGVSLGVVGGVIALAVVGSLLFPKAAEMPVDVDSSP